MTDEQKAEALATIKAMIDTGDWWCSMQNEVGVGQGYEPYVRRYLTGGKVVVFTNIEGLLDRVMPNIESMLTA